MQELTFDELDDVSGGMVFIPLMAGGIAKSALYVAGTLGGLGTLVHIVKRVVT